MAPHSAINGRCAIINMCGCNSDSSKCTCNAGSCLAKVEPPGGCPAKEPNQ